MSMLKKLSRIPLKQYLIWLYPAALFMFMIQTFELRALGEIEANHRFQLSRVDGCRKDCSKNGGFVDAPQNRSSDGCLVLSGTECIEKGGFEGFIDVVYLWVNGSDPIRLEQMELFGGEVGIHKGAVSGKRSREWNELYYSLRLLYRHATNLRHVYIITAGERPFFAHQFPQIRWVKDTEIVPHHALPTFSSVTVQFSLIGLLPRLSDPFILMDDDWFILKPIDLFIYASSKIWYEDEWGENFHPGMQSKDLFITSLINSNQALARVYPSHQPRNGIGHLPVVVRHHTLRRVCQDMGAAVNASLTRFRSNSSLQFHYVLAQVERHIDPETVFQPSETVSDFIMMGQDIDKNMEQFAKVRSNPNFFFCLNDDIKDPEPKHRGVIQAFLASLVSLSPTDTNSGLFNGDMLHFCTKSHEFLPLPPVAYALPPNINGLLHGLTVRDRERLLTNPMGMSAGDLTSSIKDLDLVDIDNSISTAPPPQRGIITVAELNADRGRFWCEFALQIRRELKNVDVWLLNEFDLGMSRSEQLYTVRLLAHAVDLNYAWGAEFVELTKGNKEEQQRTVGMKNRWGLQGNAILSRWPLYNASIVRMPGMAQLYSSEGPEDGYEKRLGGRMTLFAMTVGGILLGATHAQISWEERLDHVNEATQGMLDQINSIPHTAAIVAGETWPTTCSLLGFDALVDKKQPSSRVVGGKVKKSGHSQDDYICGRNITRMGLVKAIPGAGHAADTKKEFVLSDHNMVILTVQIGNTANVKKVSGRIRHNQVAK